MGRAERLILTLVGFSLVLVGVPEAQGARVWDRASPIDLVGGLEAVVSHPTDPRIWWVSDGARVWVTDDGGDSYGLVLRATGARRARARGAETAREDENLDQVTPDTSSDSDGTAFDLPVADPSELATTAEALGLKESTSAPRRSRIRAKGKAALPEIIERVGSRLRLVGDRVFLCGVVGLWSAEISARALGTDREHRFGRSIPVFDITEDRHGKRWVATAEGLFVLREGDRAMPTRGNASRDPVVSMATLGRHLVGGNPEGLWIGDGHYIVRVGLLSGASMPLDVLALDEQRLAVATGDEVWVVLFPAEGSPRVESQWPVAGASRLARSADGKLLAAGSQGLWVEEEPGSWTRSAEGLSDRRLRDVAGPAVGGDAISLVVSRAGAFRYITEMAKIIADRGRAAMAPYVKGASTSRDVVLASYASRRATHARVSRWRSQRASSFLLPEIQISYHSFLRRYEQGILVDALDKIVLTDVQVTPGEPELRIFASWDLYPILFANPELERHDALLMAVETRNVLEDRLEIEETVVPLYNRWVEARVKAHTHDPGNAKAALKAAIELAHLEADLHVHTGGAFHAPPLLKTATSRSDQGESP